MGIVELVRLFAATLDVAVLVTDRDLERPGPTILYANAAFARMSGYEPVEVVGNSPRMLQGPATNRQVTRAMMRRLREEGRCRGVVLNHRGSGEAYLCELDVRAIHGRDGAIQAFIAFECEVVRRRGRPAPGLAGRYTSLASAPTAQGTSLSLVPDIFDSEG